MNVEEVESIVHATPFRPYRLVLIDGEEIQVRRPKKSHVSGDQIALVGQCRKPGQPSVEKFRLVGVDRVTLAEAINCPNA